MRRSGVLTAAAITSSTILSLAAVLSHGHYIALHEARRSAHYQNAIVPPTIEAGPRVGASAEEWFTLSGYLAWAALGMGVSSLVLAAVKKSRPLLFGSMVVLGVAVLAWFFAGVRV